MGDHGDVHEMHGELTKERMAGEYLEGCMAKTMASLGVSAACNEQDAKAPELSATCTQ
jgi:hypothetical protein